MNDIWLGSEVLYNAAMAALGKVEAYNAEHPDRDEEENPYLQVVDGVAIITVSGALLDGRYGIVGSWFGITGYGDISEALVSAVSNPEVGSIMLVIKSGGGTVSGVAETAELIATVDSIKPVTTYSPSTMASAALWLGVTGRKVFAGRTALVGSIGAMTVVMSKSRMLEENGIDAKVVRSGEHKALGHPVDPMQEAAIEDAQKRVDYMASIFMSHVADRRNMSLPLAQSRFGKAGVFIGEEAKSLGLVDAIVSYSAAFSSTKALAKPDNGVRVIASTVADVQCSNDNSTQVQGNTPMKTKPGTHTHTPSAEQLEAMAAAGVMPGGEGGEDADDSSVTGAVAETIEGFKAQVLELTTQLSTEQAALASLKAEHETLVTEFGVTKAALEKATTDNEALAGLAEIALNSIKVMNISLNVKSDLSNVGLTELAALHKETAAKFKEKFRAGGVAATAPESGKTKSEKSEINPLFAAAAQLNSTK